MYSYLQGGGRECTSYSSSSLLESFILIANEDGVVLWNIRESRILTKSTSRKPSHGINSIVLSKDGTLFATSSKSTSVVTLWSITSDHMDFSAFHSLRPLHPANCSTVSRNFKWIVVALPLGLQVLKLSDGELLCSILTTQSILTCVLYNNDTRVITGSDDGIIRIWNLSSKRCEKELIGHTSMILKCRLSVDEQYLISSSDDTSVRIWDLQSGVLVHSLFGHTADVVDCAISNDNKLVGSVSWDNTVRLWDFKSGKALSILGSHSSGVVCCSFSSDSSFLVTGGYDKSVRVWDLKNETCTVLEGASVVYDIVVFSPFADAILWPSSHHHLSPIMQATTEEFLLVLIQYLIPRDIQILIIKKLIQLAAYQENAGLTLADLFKKEIEGNEN